MDIAEKYFEKKTFDRAALLAFGFSEYEGKLAYHAPLPNGQFTLLLEISPSAVISRVYETATSEEYVLYRVSDATGSFVGELRAQAEEIFEKITDACCRTEVFRLAQTKRVIAYAGEKYRSDAEYLWDKFPDNAVLRRSDSKKWYAAILTVNRNKFFPGAEGNVEVIDLREESAVISSLIDGKTYFRGYHMNKQHWYTILLDESVCDEELFSRIDKSFRLATK